jgi:hypothetical protein
VKWIATITSILVLGLAGSAQGSTVVESPNPIYQQWVDRARVVTPNLTVQVVEDPCFDAAAGETDGCTAPGMPIYVTPDEDLQRTFYHELGHQYDYATGASAA